MVRTLTAYLNGAVVKATLLYLEGAGLDSKVMNGIFLHVKGVNSV
jgi:hypothetical protein